MHIQATHSHHKLLSVFHSEAENICPVHAFTSVGKLWDGCHGSMPPTVVTWCLKATCCCFLYVAYFPDVGTVGNNECCCRSNDVGNFFLPFPYLSFPLSLPHPHLVLLYPSQLGRNPNLVSLTSLVSPTVKCRILEFLNVEKS